jgi:hypothetical protein
MDNSTIFYAGRNGVTVTDRYFRSRHKDQALAPITSIRIGREPLCLSLALGLGLALFGVSFGDLLHFQEQLVLVTLGIVLVAGGYAVASLQLGTYVHERTMLWGDYWTVRSIRNAIIEARGAHKDSVTVEVAGGIGEN